MKKIFITYGNLNYSESIYRIRKEAFRTNYFDKIICYTPEMLPKTITENRLFKYEKGGGYWLWKPYIIYKTLSNEYVEEDDIIIYCDAGCTIFKNEEWNRYFNIMQKNDMLAFYLGSSSLKQWTKRAIIDYYSSLGNYWKNKYLISATFLIVKKRSILMIKEWLNTMLKHPDFIIDDEQAFKIENSYFKENRHDQSILTPIIYKNKKKYNIKLQCQNFETLKKNQAVFASRISNSQKQRSLAYENSIISIMKKHILYPIRFAKILFWDIINDIFK